MEKNTYQNTKSTNALWKTKIRSFFGNCFRHHMNAPDSKGKDETVLKFFFQNMYSGFFFPEQNFILWIFLFRMDFSFFFQIFISEIQ